jgi:hypothetical protein
MPDPERVAIVFEDNPELVERLVREIPVWAARSDRIESVAPRLRGDGVDLTTFNFDPGGDVEGQLLGLIHEVELHHGASGGRLPLARLDVYGASLTPRTTAVLERLGLPSVRPGAERFSATPSDA